MPQIAPRALTHTAALVPVLWVLAGCASTDRVVFVTKTSLGIDFDSTTRAASIAYDRIEGYTAPRYANGEIPPVVASIKSDGSIFNPKIRQVYATGDAAEIVLGGRPVNQPARRLKGDKALMFFGTTTTTGLKLSLTTGLPDSLSFGYKRKEFSYIPLATAGTGKHQYDIYPAILASIDTQATAGTAEKTGLSNVQFFATGQAARLLAANDGVQQAFETEAQESIQASQLKRLQADVQASTQTRQRVSKIRDGFNKLPDLEAKQAVLAAANGRLADEDLKQDYFLDPDEFDVDIVNFSKAYQQPDLADLLAKIQTDINTRLPK